ncbi:hypothetical protein CARUB_v10006312mg [Capsella rubella]|uniref:Uncharacterized protein n=1 Tax=Capsella rubella TaxID=81985 RepID=R0H326_9BRAS|nr:hypothetical protein CARUB_v10006312mg [Capsella rubella]
MTYEGGSNDTSSDSYSGGYVFRLRDKRKRRALRLYAETQTKPASEETIEFTKNEDEEVISSNDMDEDEESDKEKSEDDDLCVLKDLLEAVATTQGISQYQKSLMFRNSNNLGAETRKELIDAWKEFSAVVLRLMNVKKRKFAKAGV